MVVRLSQVARCSGSGSVSMAGFVEGDEQGGQVVGVFGYLVGGPQFRRPVDGFRQSKQIPGPGLVRLAVFSVHRPERDVLHLGSADHSDAAGRPEHLGE